MLRFYLLLLMPFISFAHAGETMIPLAQDFVADSRQALQNKTPILIIFSIPNCKYCEKIKQEIILPMLTLKEYDSKVIIRHINAGTLNALKNFDKQNSNHGKFAFVQGVNFFPTVMLFAHDGMPLGKMVGVANFDYYWSELDKIINQSTLKFKQRLQAKL